MFTSDGGASQGSWASNESTTRANGWRVRAHWSQSAPRSNTFVARNSSSGRLRGFERRYSTIRGSARVPRIDGGRYL